MLDASWHGVPQGRKRLFVIGIREDIALNPDDVPALKETLSGTPALRKYPLTALEALEGKALTELEEIYGKIFREYRGIYEGGGVVEDYLRLRGGKPGDPLFERAMEEHAGILDTMGWSGVSLTEAAEGAYPDGTHVRAKESATVRERIWEIPQAKTAWR